MTQGQRCLQRLVAAQGSLRAAATTISAQTGRSLGHRLLGRWVSGEGAPGDGWRPLLAPWVPVDAWDRTDASPLAVKAPPARPEAPKASRPVRPHQRPATRQPGASTTITERPPPPPPVVAPPPAQELDAPRPPQTVEELQRRARAVPGELARLRADVAAGRTAITAAEPLRRLLEGEARAIKGAIEAAGVATVAEVEALRKLLVEATRGCDACRARVVEGLRAAGGGS